jgi:hypothetical protein
MARKALLCGINAYPGAALRGCINDAENLRSLLIKFFDFRPQEIHLLKDEQVVKSNLQKEWQWLTAGARAGDTLVFHFSGHGSNVPDLNGDEPDHRDEITCLYDIDFNNPASYLSDDEWYDWVQKVNPEAHLIIIKDTCHSGGSSRFLPVQDEAGFERIILAETHQLQGRSLSEAISEQSVTNARFLVPPDLPAQGWRSGEAAATVINPSRLSEVEQVSLMACQETQTAADAYINGRFNGAFTYYLCQALRSNRQLGTQQLIDTVVRLLRGKYEQIPQLEGQALPAPIFGQPTRIEDGPEAELPAPPQAVADLGDTQSTQQLLIQAYLKLLDTVTALQGVAPALAGPGRGVRRVLVTVHGIGSHSAGYSNAWWQALQPHVGTTFDPSGLGQGRQEVIWSDLVNRGRSLTRSLDTAEVNRLRQSILDVIEDRREHVAAQNRSLDQMPAMRGSEIAIDDFLVYMLDDGMRRQIIKRFTDVVGPLLLAGATVDIISHSWGTVVAYEGLRELEQRSGLVGRVANWFTAGSALSIAPVQGRLRPENRPTGNRLAPDPALVDTWINLDAQGDLVGGPLARKFPVNREYLELPPVTCPRRLWGYDLTCAHRSYFQPANLKVNRDIFAAHILGTARGFEVEDVGELDSEPYNNGAGEFAELAAVDP